MSQELEGCKGQTHEGHREIVLNRHLVASLTSDWFGGCDLHFRASTNTVHWSPKQVGGKEGKTCKLNRPHALIILEVMCCNWYCYVIIIEFGERLKGSLPKGSFDKRIRIDLPVPLPVPTPPPPSPPLSHLKRPQTSSPGTPIGTRTPLQKLPLVKTTP